MITDKNIIKADKLLDALDKNKGRIAIKTSNSKCHKEVAMSYNETTNLLEQGYYDRASGCSVKAQENNIFDYDVYLKD